MGLSKKLEKPKIWLLMRWQTWLIWKVQIWTWRMKSQLPKKLTLLKLSLKTGLPEEEKFLIELPQLLRPEMPLLKKPGDKKTKEMPESGTTESKILLMPKKISKMKFWTPKLDLKIPLSITELLLTGKPSKTKLKMMST